MQGQQFAIIGGKAHPRVLPLQKIKEALHIFVEILGVAIGNKFEQLFVEIVFIDVY